MIDNGVITAGTTVTVHTNNGGQVTGPLRSPFNLDWLGFGAYTLELTATSEVGVEHPVDIDASRITAIEYQEQPA